MTTQQAKVIQLFSSTGGILRMSDALAKGINRYTFYSLVAKGHIVKLSRGLYRLAIKASIQNPDMAVIALRIPKAVFCLISALAYHELTTQIPHSVEIALPLKTKTPKLDYPILTVHRFSPVSYATGIETVKMDTIDLRIYSREKTLADCFKFRNKIGLDIFLEALKFYRKQESPDYQKILYFAKLNRVEKVITPYLEASLI